MVREKINVQTRGDNMQLTDIGHLIASRKLELTENNSTRSVTIKIGKPQKFVDGDDYYCPFQVIGLGDEKINWSGGIDEVQALLLALEQIGLYLIESEEYKQGKLSWVGSDKGNLGFPCFDSAGILADAGVLTDF
jgi:hypothetical protein